jgi:hypothetical protein
VSQGIIDYQGDSSRKGQPSDQEQEYLIGELGGAPGRAFEEVVITVEAVSAGVIGRRLRLDGVSDAFEGVFSETHHPGHAELRAGEEGRLGESRGEGLDTTGEGGYDFPHGGDSVPVMVSSPTG